MNAAQNNFLEADRRHILQHTLAIWETFRGQRIFLTGGTGFFGCWLLESFLYAQRELNLDMSVCVLTRDKAAFQRKAPHIAHHPAIEYHEGDIRDFSQPPGHFAQVIHAATEASAALNRENPLLMFDTIVQGTRRVLEMARASGAKSCLLISSGAVYGRQPPELSHCPETYPGVPDPLCPTAAYGVGKYAAEHLATLFSAQHQLPIKIARCFAFVGPYLPLDTHFAIGNFMRDALQGRAITLSGDGSPYRSYLYAADLVIWLWHILCRGVVGRPYNVGSRDAISIRELAHLIASTFSPQQRVVLGREAANDVLPERYVPCTQRATSELQLSQHIGLRDAILRTQTWHVLGTAALSSCEG